MMTKKAQSLKLKWAVPGRPKSIALQDFICPTIRDGFLLAGQSDFYDDLLKKIPIPHGFKTIFKDTLEGNWSRLQSLKHADISKFINGCCELSKNASVKISDELEALFDIYCLYASGDKEVEKVLDKNLGKLGAWSVFFYSFTSGKGGLRKHRDGLWVLITIQELQGFLLRWRVFGTWWASKRLWII